MQAELSEEQMTMVLALLFSAALRKALSTASLTGPVRGCPPSADALDADMLATKVIKAMCACLLDIVVEISEPVQVTQSFAQVFLVFQIM